MKKMEGFVGVCRCGVAATALWATAELENWTQSVTKVRWTSFGLDSRQIHTNISTIIIQLEKGCSQSHRVVASARWTKFS